MAPGHSLRRRWATPRRCSAGSCSHTAISSPRCGRRFETTGCPRLARRRGRTRPPDVRGNAREADPQDSHPLAHPRTSSSPTGRTRTPARSPHGNIPQPSSSPRPGSSTASPANPRRLRPSRHRHQPRHPPRIRRRASPSPRPPPTMTSSPRPSQLDPRRTRVQPRVRRVRRRSTGRSRGRDDGFRGAVSSLSTRPRRVAQRTRRRPSRRARAVRTPRRRDRGAACGRPRRPRDARRGIQRGTIGVREGGGGDARVAA